MNGNYKYFIINYLTLVLASLGGEHDVNMMRKDFTASEKFGGPCE